MLKSTILDTRIRLRPSKKVVDLLTEQMEQFKEMPANLANLLKNNGYDISKSIRILNDNEMVCSRPLIDKMLLQKLTADAPDSLSNITNISEADEEEQEEQHKPRTGHFIYLTDLHWINSTLIELRKKNLTNLYLYELIENSELILPENEYKQRNPELEARCQRLREEQQNREYHKMTKNVDATLKHVPEDTVAYQLKSINKQIIAVAQFIFSVAAGFTFGFFGVNLMIGPLPFGFRILLGVIVGLIIALAEMYFLAKKLHEYDEVLDKPKRKTPHSPKVSGVQNLKPHND